MNRTNVDDRRDDESHLRDAELIRRLREIGAWLGEHGAALDVKR